MWHLQKQFVAFLSQPCACDHTSETFQVGTLRDDLKSDVHLIFSFTCNDVTFICSFSCSDVSFILMSCACTNIHTRVKREVGANRCRVMLFFFLRFLSGDQFFLWFWNSLVPLFELDRVLLLFLRCLNPLRVVSQTTNTSGPRSL